MNLDYFSLITWFL